MRIIAVVLLLALTGCASVGEVVLKAGTTGDVRFDANDVRAAINIAVDTKDKAAESCYRAILKHTEARKAHEVIGPVSRYAEVRANVREARAPLAEDVHNACSPLVVDAGSFVSRLAFTLGR